MLDHLQELHALLVKDTLPDDYLGLFRKEGIEIINYLTGEVYDSIKILDFDFQIENLKIQKNHFQGLDALAFEHIALLKIHPFYDGNGRIGRYILSKYLSRKLDIYTGLGVSQFLNENRKAYYKAFTITGEADNKAEGTFFVLHLLTIIYEGQQNLIDDLKFKKVQLASAIQKIEFDSTLSEVERTVLVG